MAKHIFIELNERNGEQEYRQHSLVVANDDEIPENVAEQEAKYWYDATTAEEDETGFFHLGGTVHVSVKRVEVISKEVYDVLNKYI